MTEDFAKRVKSARVALGMSQEDVAKIAGTTQSTIERIENGGSRRSRYRDEVAAAVGITVKNESKQVASQPEDTPRPLPLREDPNRLVPVYASAEGGDGSMVISSDPIGYEPRPNLLTNEFELYGVVIEGTSMMKAYRPGDTAWVHPKYRERRDEPCLFRRYDEATGEASMTVKWLNDFNTSVWKVEQFNPPKEFELKRSDWPECYRVLGKKNRA